MTRILVADDGAKLAKITFDPFDVERLDGAENVDVDVFDLFGGIEDATSIDAGPGDDPEREQSPAEEWVEATPDRKRRLASFAVDEAEANLSLLSEDEAAEVA